MELSIAAQLAAAYGGDVSADEVTRKVQQGILEQQTSAAELAKGVTPQAYDAGGSPFDFDASLNDMVGRMTYGGLPEQIARAEVLRDPAQLGSMTMRELRLGLGKELGVTGRWDMNKADLINAIQGVGATQATTDLLPSLSGMSGVELGMLGAEIGPAGMQVVNAATPQRQKLYTMSQAMFGFNTQNVDTALGRTGLNWSQVEGMGQDELSAILHGPIAQEFIARGGQSELRGDPGDQYMYYYAPRAARDVEAIPEGMPGAKRGGRLIAGAQSAALSQAQILQQGRTVTRSDKSVLGPQEIYRSGDLVGNIQHVLQEPGIAARVDENGMVTSVITGDPKKAGKRISQISQQHGISFPNLPTVQSNVLGQMADTPETVQQGRAWLSFGEWLPQGAGMYGTHLGRPTTQITRRIRLPEGEEISVQPGQKFGAGERVPVFGSHTGFDFGKNYSEVVVQQATPVHRRGPDGERYTEVEFQALGMAPSGTLVANKHWIKHGMSGDTLPTEMGVDFVLAPNEVFQLGAMIQSVAPESMRQEIWGENADRWGPESGKQFTDWLTGPNGPLEERLLPAQTFDLADPVTQKLLGLGKLVNPETGEAYTADTARGGQLPGTKGAISAQLLDIGFEADVGMRATQAFAGRASVIKPETFAAVAERQPRLAHELFRGGLRHQKEAANILGALTANERPDSEVGQAYAAAAMTGKELRARAGDFRNAAIERLHEAGIEDVGQVPQLMQSALMDVIGEALGDRGIAMEGASPDGETRYFPNPRSVMRQFGYPFQEGVLNQLPLQMAQMLEAEMAQGREEGSTYLPADRLPEGKTPDDYTPEQLEKMAQQYRRERVEGAYQEMQDSTRSKETLMNLIGVKAGKHLIGAHPTAVTGVSPNKYVAGEDLLRQMIIAPGASDEDREDLMRQIREGKVAGPRVNIVGYPIVDAGQADISLGYTPEIEAMMRGMADSPEELNEMYAGRLGVSQLVAYGQEKDWDVDEFLRMVSTKYEKDDQGNWRAMHLSKQSSVDDIVHMATEGSISGELARHTEKIDERATLPDVRKWVRGKADQGELALSELQAATEEKRTGGMIKGSTYNTFFRRLSSRLTGHPGAEHARRPVDVPYQTALDIKELPKPWQNILNRINRFDMATLGWSETDPETGETVPHGYSPKTGMRPYVEDMIKDVVALPGMDGELLGAADRAAMLVSPAKDEGLWKQVTAQIQDIDAMPEGRDKRRAISSSKGLYGSVTGGADLTNWEGLEELYNRSPVMAAGLEASAWKAVRKGEAVPGQAVTRTTSRGNVVTETFGRVRSWLARQGELVDKYIKGMSPQAHLPEPERPGLVERFDAAYQYVGEYSEPNPVIAKLVQRAHRLASPENPWQHMLRGVDTTATPVAQEPDLGNSLDALAELQGIQNPPVEDTGTYVTRPAAVRGAVVAETQGPIEDVSDGQTREDPLAVARRTNEEIKARRHGVAPPPGAGGPPSRRPPGPPPPGGGGRPPGGGGGVEPPSGGGGGDGGDDGGNRVVGQVPLPFNVDSMFLEEYPEGWRWSLDPKDEGGFRFTSGPKSKREWAPADVLDLLDYRIETPNQRTQHIRDLTEAGIRGSAFSGLMGIASGKRPTDPQMQAILDMSGMDEDVSGRLEEILTEFEGAGVAEGGELPSDFARLRGKSRPGREEILSLVAEGKISQSQATSLMLKSASRQQRTSLNRGEREAISYAAHAGPAYENAAPVVERAMSLATGKASAAEQVEKFTDALKEARDNLDKYGDMMKEQVADVQAGRQKMTPELKRDLGQMVSTAQQLERMAAGGVPKEAEEEYGRWQELLGVARDAGMAPSQMGEGLGNPQGIGFFDKYIPKGKGLLGGDLGALSYGMFNLQRIWNYTGGQVTKDMNQYATYAGQQQQAMAGLGIGEGYGGAAQDVMSGQATMERFKLGMGKAAWQTWGWIPRMVGGVDADMDPGILERGVQFARPVAGIPLGLNMAANVAKRMGMAGAAGKLGFVGSMAARAAPVAGGLWLGTEMASELMPEDYETGGDAAAHLIRMMGSFSPVFGGAVGVGKLAGQLGLTGVQRGAQQVASWAQRGGFLGGAANALAGSSEEVSPAVRAFQDASMELQTEFGLKAAAADQALARYGQTTGRTVESGDWGKADIQAAARLARLAPGVAGQVSSGGANLALASGVPMGDVRQAEFQEWYADLNPTQQWGRAQVAGMVQPLQMETYHRTGEFAEIDARSMSVPDAYNLQQLASGNRFAWSRAGLAQGMDEQVTVNPDTGMGVGTNWGGGVLARQIQAGRFTMGSLSQKAFETSNIQIDASEATVVVGGKEAPLTQVGLRDLSTRMQRDEQGYQRTQQLTSMGAQYAYTTGRMPGWAPEGTPQIGRGTWAIQDEQVALAYQHQMTGFGFQREQLDMQDRQFYENWGLQSQRMGVQTAWARQDMGRNFQRQMTQLDWSEEDLAFQGAQTSLHYAWGQEDLQEQMRYATGRQRRALMKQQGRATIDYATSMGRLDTQDDRLDQRREWAEEDFQRERGRFEQRTQWSRQSLEQQRRNHEEQMGLSRRRLQESQRYYEDNFALQEEQRANSREYWEFTIQKQIDAIEHAKGLQEQLQTVQDLMTGLAEAQQEQTTWFASQFDPSGPLVNNWQGFVNVMLSSINQMSAAASGYDQVIRGNPYSIPSPR